MSKLAYTLAIICFPLFIAAQNIAINNDGSSAHPNAMLDIKGVNKGLLIPRGDAATRTALSSNTAKGLMMYDTTTQSIWVHNGNALSSGWGVVSSGTNYWQQSGALGIEIKNTNEGGFWSNGPYIDQFTDPGAVTVPVSGIGTRLMWMPFKSAFRVGTVVGAQWDANNIGTWSFASGFNAIARGPFSAAFGREAQANDESSFATGYNVLANGRVSFVAGSGATAKGDFSSALGYGTLSDAFASTAVGYYNDTSTSSTIGSAVDADPLFYVGNGINPSNRHSALTIYKNGNTILKNKTQVTTNPGAYTLPVSGAGTRMMWLPGKSAFRVGTVGNNRWDASNIGLYSFASGRANLASGQSSTAMGDSSVASGDYSFAAGFRDTASNVATTAIGAGYYDAGFGLTYTNYSKASGYFSTALAGGEASGNGSIAIGVNAVASGQGAFAAGPFNVAGGAISFAGSSGTTSGLRATAFSNGYAIGNSSISLGDQSYSSTVSSVTIGDRDTAFGLASTAIGRGTYSKAAYSTSLGQFNDYINSSNTSSFVLTDPLLIVGNGTTAAARSNALVIYKNGNTDISGYTQLGKTSDGAPAVKMKKFTGVSSNVQNNWVNIAHGLNAAKILAVDVLMDVPGFVHLPPSYTFHPQYQYDVHISTTNIVILNVNGNSANVLSKAFRVLITYEE